MTKPVSREPVMSVWAGLPNFGCPFCAFSSPDQAAFDQHITFTHPVESDSPLLAMRPQKDTTPVESDEAVNPDAQLKKGVKPGKEEG